jgi:NAD+ kinase
MSNVSHKQKIIALFPNMSRPDIKQVANSIIDFLTKQKVKVVMDDEHAKTFGIPKLSSVPLKNVDVVITLGGDGTILRLVHRHPDLTSAIMPVNMGGLGFMADITLEEVTESLKKLLLGNYKIEKRMALEGFLGGNNCIAINDIVIHRGANPSLTDLAIYVDDIYLNTFSADGIIFSTPSGSTAYSLSAGGPILTPTLKAIVVTPICPHTISNRPLVLLPKNEFRVEFISNHQPIQVIYDGFPSSPMSKGDSLLIKLSDKEYNFVRMPSHDYFSTLRSKLNWSGKLKI